MLASAVKVEALPRNHTRQFSGIVSNLAIDKGLLNRSTKSVSLERRPAALGQHIIRRNGGWRIRIDDDEVRKPAFPGITAIYHTKYIGRRVADPIHEQLDGDLSALDKLLKYRLDACKCEARGEPEMNLRTTGDSTVKLSFSLFRCRAGGETAPLRVSVFASIGLLLLH